LVILVGQANFSSPADPITPPIYEANDGLDHVLVGEEL